MKEGGKEGGGRGSLHCLASDHKGRTRGLSKGVSITEHKGWQHQNQESNIFLKEKVRPYNSGFSAGLEPTGLEWVGMRPGDGAAETLTRIAPTLISNPDGSDTHPKPLGGMGGWGCVGGG